MKRRPRPAQMVTLPVFDYSFRFDAASAPQRQVENFWIPPVPDEPEMPEDMALPVPDISTFHVAGFDIKAKRRTRPNLYLDRAEVKLLEVQVSMHVVNQKTGDWTTVQSQELIHLNDRSKEDVAEQWKFAIHRMVIRLLSHEVDESLRFDGEYHRHPHPDTIFKPD